MDRKELLAELMAERYGPPDQLEHERPGWHERQKALRQESRENSNYLRRRGNRMKRAAQARRRAAAASQRDARERVRKYEAAQRAS